MKAIKVTPAQWKMLAVVVIGVIAAQEILPYYVKARNAVVKKVKGA